MLPDQPGDPRQNHGKAEHEGPADDLPSAHFAPQLPAFRIPKRSANHGAQQSEVCSVKGTAAGGERKADHGGAAGRARAPEPEGGTFVSAEKPRDGCRGRQQTEHDGTVGSIDALHRPGAEHGKTDDHPQHHQGETPKLGSRRKRLAGEEEQRSHEAGGDQFPAEPDKERMQ